MVFILFTLVTNLLYTSFLTTTFFTTLNLLKSTGIGTNLSTLVFELAKFVSNAKLEVSACEIFLISAFVA